MCKTAVRQSNLDDRVEHPVGYVQTVTSFEDVISAAKVAHLALFSGFARSFLKRVSRSSLSDIVFATWQSRSSPAVCTPPPALVHGFAGRQL